MLASSIGQFRAIAKHLNRGLSMDTFKTASSVAACIIGDEVLNGKTLDTNSNYLGLSTFH